jgi:glycosyltransferase involved in cell wall biosynthesis
MRAFPIQRPHVRLVLKLDGAAIAPNAIALLRAQAAACACPVELMTGALERKTRDALIASADVIVSLHRSEGFGLTLAEAMMAGRPVIATGWSGNLDFMTPDKAVLVSSRLCSVIDEQGFYDPTLRWADPDIDEAARWMQLMATNVDLRRYLGKAGRRIDLPARFRAALSESIIATFVHQGDHDRRVLAPRC